MKAKDVFVRYIKQFKEDEVAIIDDFKVLTIIKNIAEYCLTNVDIARKLTNFLQDLMIELGEKEV